MKQLLMDLHPSWSEWLAALKVPKKEFNALWKLLTGIYPEAALPGRAKAVIKSEVMAFQTLNPKA